MASDDKKAEVVKSIQELLSDPSNEINEDSLSKIKEIRDKLVEYKDALQGEIPPEPTEKKQIDFDRLSSLSLPEFTRELAEIRANMDDYDIDKEALMKLRDIFPQQVNKSVNEKLESFFTDELDRLFTTPEFFEDNPFKIDDEDKFEQIVIDASKCALHNDIPDKLFDKYSEFREGALFGGIYHYFMGLRAKILSGVLDGIGGQHEIHAEIPINPEMLMGLLNGGMIPQDKPKEQEEVTGDVIQCPKCNNYYVLGEGCMVCRRDEQ